MACRQPSVIEKACVLYRFSRVELMTLWYAFLRYGMAANSLSGDATIVYVIKFCHCLARPVDSRVERLCDMLLEYYSRRSTGWT